MPAQGSRILNSSLPCSDTTERHGGRSLQCFDLHHNRLGGPQGDCWTNPNGLVTGKLQSKPLGDHRKHERRLKHGECITNAYAWTAAERKIRIFRQAAGEIVGPAVGIKPEGVSKPSRIAVHNPLAHQHVGASRKEVSADRQILHRPPSYHVSRRIEPHRFANHHLAESQLRNIGCGWWAAAKYG